MLTEDELYERAIHNAPIFLRAGLAEMEVRINALEEIIARHEASCGCEMADVNDGLDHTYRCSRCGWELDMSGFDAYPWDFCPMCGAKVMDDGD